MKEPIATLPDENTRIIPLGDNAYTIEITARTTAEANIIRAALDQDIKAPSEEYASECNDCVITIKATMNGLLLMPYRLDRFHQFVTPEKHRALEEELESKLGIEPKMKIAPAAVVEQIKPEPKTFFKRRHNSVTENPGKNSNASFKPVPKPRRLSQGKIITSIGSSGDKIPTIKK
jgi:hypothetical protein